jgi:polyhydroxyalkanoate synthesis repressor PhaR
MTTFALQNRDVKYKMKPKTPPRIVIKKYENRRLYNTLTSQYINQEQVAELVRDGHDVYVIDAATGDDITRLILAQIVLEDAKTPNSVFPLDVLRQMVLATGQATQESATRYFKTMMDMYQNAYRMMPTPPNPFEFLPNVWSQTRGATDAPHPPETPGSYRKEREPGSAEGSQNAESEIQELRRRMEELEAALSRRHHETKSGRTASRKSKAPRATSRRKS